MRLHHGQRRAGGRARIIAVDVGVESGRNRRKGCKLSAVCRRTGQRANETAAVGVARGIDARLVDAVVVLDAIDEIGCEDLVTDSGCRIRRALPVALRELESLLHHYTTGIYVR